MEELRDIGEASTFAPTPDVPESDDAGGAGGTLARTRIADTTVHPYRAIASLRITAADGSRWLGTAFFISRRTLATAGHVVCIKNSPVPARNGPVSSIEVIPARNGDLQPFGSAVSRTFHAPPEWSENANSNHDYGAIVLDAPFAQQIGPFGFGVYTDAELMAVTANLSGYPFEDLPPGEVGTQWFHSRRLKSAMAKKVFYDTDTSKGQSGAPAWRIINRRRFAFAIHTFGGKTTNAGTRITAAVHANLTSWMA
jgi:V8-like Glu-specific endopeptidase